LPAFKAGRFGNHHPAGPESRRSGSGCLAANQMAQSWDRAIYDGWMRRLPVWKIIIKASRGLRPEENVRSPAIRRAWLSRGCDLHLANLRLANLS